MPPPPSTPPSLRHLALIPDGNRRWARARRLPDAEGHRQGFLSVAPEVVRWWLRETAIPDLTLWLFSTDNWRRSPSEIAALMDTYAAMIPALAAVLAADPAARLRHLGRADRLPPRLARALADACADRPDPAPARTLRLALDYGGQEEIAAAACALAAAGQPPTREAIAALLPPPPDLIVRTSGEQRLSGFLLWGSAAAEIMFLAPCWPDLRPADLDACVARFCQIERRYGA